MEPVIQGNPRWYDSFFFTENDKKSLQSKDSYYPKEPPPKNFIGVDERSMGGSRARGDTVPHNTLCGQSSPKTLRPRSISAHLLGNVEIVR